VAPRRAAQSGNDPKEGEQVNCNGTRTLPARCETLARLGQAEEVVVPRVPGGPLDSAGAVVEVIKERPDTQAALLGNHGLLAFGPDAETAVSLLVALQEAAEAELRAAAIGGAGPA
jgi:L-fuculose-phosphate aldolase